MRLHQNKVGGGTHLLVGGVSLLTLLILGAMIFPALPQTAQAEEAESKVSLSVAPVISLSLQDTVAVEVTPTQDGTFSSNTAALSISTNNETGYSLYMATGNGKNTLTSQNPGISNFISAVNGGDNGVTSANFTNNTWGYNLSQEAVSDTTTYKAVPTANGDTALITTESPTEADTYNLTFGTKVDTSLPSGTYSNDVVVSVVANPTIITSLTQLTYMQDMTPEICASSTENDTTRLTDIRDGKQYWVAKLADGNCWMTQNLALDLSVDTQLTPEDSDVSSPWTPGWDTQTDAKIGIDNSAETLSWNLGEYVLSTPIAGNECSDGSSFGLPVSAFANCVGGGFVEVSTMSPMTELSDNGTVIDGNKYDAHYLTGNYYQWNAATAGTEDAITDEDADGSICPRGWRLPTGNNQSSGSFYYLLSQYGLSSSISSEKNNIAFAPLYLLRGGFVQTTVISTSPQPRAPDIYMEPGLRSAGGGGNYLTSTADSAQSDLYSLYFDMSTVYPNYTNFPHFGFSVRCLAR